MKRSWIVMGAMSIVLLSGCVTGPDYTKFFEHQPRSILIVPPANKTTAVDAPAIFLTTVSQAFAERGYYVYPVYLVQDILNDLGATDEGSVAAVPPEKFKEIFGTDAILYVTITEWTTAYVLIASNVTVGADYRLVDAATGEVIWTRKERFIHQSGGGGGGIGGLVAAAVSAAVTAGAVQYRPIALQVNKMAAAKARTGLPAGLYHPKFQKDREDYK